MLGKMDMFTLFEEKMRAEGLSDAVIRTFARAYNELAHGETGFIPGTAALPVEEVPDAERLPHSAVEAGKSALDRTVICKLNGGLGTGMGLNGPKALLPVKEGLTFLDIIARQVLHLRAETGARLPLLLMNSYSTRDESLAALAYYPDLVGGAHGDDSSGGQSLPLDFVQNKVPKVLKEGLVPAVWPEDPEKEWCPPGHGDIYPSLAASGLLDEMLAQGFEYLFVSNSDNLGATLDLAILGHFAQSGAPFLMEVADRTAADRKGGHLAFSPHPQPLSFRRGEKAQHSHTLTGGGEDLLPSPRGEGSGVRLILRELAQCPPEETEEFQQIDRYRYFNTNNLWIHLSALKHALVEHEGVLPLPLIRNEKPLDPTQPDSPRVYQLESAMGSAIGVFAGAQALRVPRTRFAPVKKNSDLLALWSDAYLLTEDWRIVLDPIRSDIPPAITLDDRYYAMIDEMTARFPAGAPSLIGCNSLRVQGDVRFGGGVIVRGDVEVAASEGEVLWIGNGIVLV